MIKGLFQFVFGLIRLLLIGLILAAIFHTWVIKQAMTLSLSYSLGADVSIREVKMDWKNTGFEVRGLEIGNPYSFPKGLLADIPLLIISLNIPDLTQGKLHFQAIGIDLRELQVMNAPRQGLSLFSLKPFQGGEKPSPAREGGGAPWKWSPQVMIDELVFSIGDISYLDMSGPSLRQNRYQAGIRGATYRDLRGVKDVVMIIAAETVTKMGLGYLNTQFLNLQGRSASSGSGFLNEALNTFKDAFS